MKQKLLLLMLLCIAVIASAQAQTHRVTGRVSGANDGKPISGVTVSVVGTNIVTQTDQEGNYVINVSDRGVLKFSYLGFATQEVNSRSRRTIDVQLTLSDNSISDIVVTGYTETKRERFAGAAVQLNAADVTENRPVASFTQLLQGRAPGVLVNSGTGQPGRNASIRIRGEQSIQGAGAQPLYIIDGVPIDDATFQTLNPNDFETFAILKDANSTAMYGARAGVGVVVITTKKGRAGETLITARAQTGVTYAPNFSRLNMMNTRQILDYQEQIGLITNTAVLMPGWFWSRQNPRNSGLPESTLQRYDLMLDSVRNIQTNLRDILFRNGLSQMYEVSANGGEERTQFFTSVNYFNQEGVDRTSDLERFTGRINLSHKTGKLQVQWNTQGGYSVMRQAVGDIFGNSPVNPFQMIYRGMPYDNPYNTDGSLNSGPGHTPLQTRQIANVLERNMSTMDPLRQMKINTSLVLNYDITDHIKIRNATGLDVSSTLRETYIDPGSYSGSIQVFQNGLARENQQNYSQIINTSSIHYQKDFDDVHHLNVGGFFEAIRTYYKGMGFELFNLNPGMPWTSQGAGDLPTAGNPTMPQRAASARSGYGIRSFFGLAEYSYLDRISFNANIRRDGTSRILNSDNRNITTWSIGGIWNIHNESFMKSQTLFNNLNLHASYGTVPNISSIPVNYYTIQGATVLAQNRVPNYGSPQEASFGTTNYSGSPIPGLAPLTPGNPNLRIERIQKINIGLDATAFNNRANMTLDIYRNRTIDLFVRQPLSSTSGFSNLDVNAGQMSNKGIEGSLGYDFIRNQDVSFNITAQHSINVNRIDNLGLVDEYFLGTFLIREGLPYGSHSTIDYLGAQPSDGRPMYRTLDGGITTDVSQAPSFAEFGTFIPKHMGGVSLSLRFKDFSLSTLFSYQFDVVRSNNTRNWITGGTPGFATAVNQSTELIGNQWMMPGDIAFYQSPEYDRQFTSADLQNAKFLRWRDLNVAYTVPVTKLGKINSVFKGARVYANFQNIAIWSPWNGVDPEDNNNISLVEYPNPSMAVFGIDLRF